MAYPDKGKKCPKTHPVEIPQLTTFTRYTIKGGKGFRLASGPWYTFHQDFWNGMHPEHRSELHQKCLKSRMNCRPFGSADLKKLGQKKVVMSPRDGNSSRPQPTPKEPAPEPQPAPKEPAPEPQPAPKKPVLINGDFSQGLKGWQTHGKGISVQDGRLVMKADGDNLKNKVYQRLSVAAGEGYIIKAKLGANQLSHPPFVKVRFMDKNNKALSSRIYKGTKNIVMRVKAPSNATHMRVEMRLPAYVSTGYATFDNITVR